MPERTKPNPPLPADEPRGERIAKRLARAGLCSRRDAEELVREGRVAVNGTVLKTPAVTVTATDIVTVDGRPLPEPEGARLWRYHKPAGLVTTARDEKGRPTVFEKLPEDMPRVVSVGRLDLTTEGLLLLTNDGELARHLELPATGWTRRYRVRVHGEVDEKALARLASGITIEGVQYGPVEAVLDRKQGSNAWLSVSLKEGKNREIRKLMESLGLGVTRLIRLAYGPFQLGKLDRGAVEEVPRRVLKDQLSKYFAETGTEPATPSGERPAPRLRLRRPTPAAGPAASEGAERPPRRIPALEPPPAERRFARPGRRQAETEPVERASARPGRRHAEAAPGERASARPGRQRVEAAPGDKASARPGRQRAEAAPERQAPARARRDERAGPPGRKPADGPAGRDSADRGAAGKGPAGPGRRPRRSPEEPGRGPAGGGGGRPGGNRNANRRR